MFDNNSEEAKLTSYQLNAWMYFFTIMTSTNRFGRTESTIASNRKSKGTSN